MRGARTRAGLLVWWGRSPGPVPEVILDAVENVALPCAHIYAVVRRSEPELDVIAKQHIPFPVTVGVVENVLEVTAPVFTVSGEVPLDQD